MFSYLNSLRSLGPGIIAGAANDDPSAIATFSQAGAQFGLGLLWTAVFLYPMLIVIQEMYARIGLITGEGLASAIQKKYHRKNIVYPIAALLIVANTLTIGADIGAISASTNLVLPHIPMVSVIVFFVAAGHERPVALENCWAICDHVLVPTLGFAREAEISGLRQDQKSALSC